MLILSYPTPPSQDLQAEKQECDAHPETQGRERDKLEVVGRTFGEADSGEKADQGAIVLDEGS
jgi:hypothetical protein